jgi:hypothetical protein
MGEPTQGAQGGMAEEQEGSATPGLVSSRPIAQLPERVLQGMEMSRQHVQVIGALASLSWGKALTPVMRRAVSQFCDRYGIDALTELDVLGGSFYINAEFYLRKLGELRRAGVIADFWFEHIHADPRLRALMIDERAPADVREMAARRWYAALNKRVDQNAPEDAEAICICYIVLPSGGHVVKGCKWAGNGTSVKQPRSGGAAQPNPIAENNPTLFVESASARRAARQVVSHVKDPAILPNFGEMDAELEEISNAVRPMLEQQAAINARLEAEAQRGTPHLISAGQSEYDPPRASSVPEGEPVHVFTTGPEGGLDARQIDAVAKMPDPYGNDAEPQGPGGNSSLGALEQHERDRAAWLERHPDATLRRTADGSIAQVREPVVEQVPMAPGLLDSLGLEDVPQAVQCGECGRFVSDASDHDPACSRYAD